MSTRGRIGEAPADLILTALSAFFGVVLLRLLVAGVVDRERRTARFVLLAAVALWAGGSAALRLAHDGGDPGVEAHVRRWPADEVNLVVLCAMEGLVDDVVALAREALAL